MTTTMPALSLMTLAKLLELDAILDNETELAIPEHTTDTAGCHIAEFRDTSALALFFVRLLLEGQIRPSRCHAS